MHLHALDYVLWLAAPGLQVFVLFFMHKRGLAVQLPFFYAYIIFQAVTDLYLLIVDHFSYSAYFYSYWIVTALTVLFTFTIILELFRVAFRNFAAIQNIGTAVFRWGALLVLIAALLTAFRQKTSFGVIESILLADRSARAMLCLLTLLLLLGARHLRISRRSILYGIAMGFVVYMLAKVVLDSVALMHLASWRTLRHISSLSYLSACALWLIYAACADKLPDSLTEQRAATDRFPEGQNLMDQINSIVEESIRKAHTTT